MHRRRNLITMLVLTAAVTLLAAAPGAAADEPAASPAAAAAPSPTATPALAFAATPQTVTAGDRATLTVRLPDIPGATLQLSREVAGATSFRAVGPLVADARGAVSYRVRPGTTTTYRAEYAGDGVQWLPASADVTVSVRPRVSFSVTPRVYRGHRARLAISGTPGASRRGARGRTVEGWRVGRVARP